MVAALAGAAVLTRGGAPGGDAAAGMVLLMSGLAASAGGAAALMIVFSARLSGDPRVAWVGLAVGWYCLLAIPISTAQDFDEQHQGMATAAVVLIHGVAAVLVTIILATPAPPSALAAVTRLMVGLTTLVAAAVLWGSTSPATAQALAGSRLLWFSYACVWIVGSLGVLTMAIVGRVPALGVIGAGLALLGVAEAGGSFSPPSRAGMSPIFSTLGLAAIVVVLWGSLWLARRTLFLVDDEQASQEEELRRAEARLARAVARDHDLRNGLAGLAGAAAVLGGDAGTGQLRRVVAGELQRLDGMLQTQADDASREPAWRYAVAPALEGLVMLRRSAGMDVRADVEPGLHAVGSPRTLAQVVTNLLSNAERHAPDSPVRITARCRGRTVEVRVRDFGPGIAPGLERAVLEPGVCDERAGGSGLGLHLCRTLLVAENATIEVGSAGDHSPGCEVLLVLPAREEARPEPSGAPRGHLRAAS